MPVWIACLLIALLANPAFYVCLYNCFFAESVTLRMHFFPGVLTRKVYYQQISRNVARNSKLFNKFNYTEALGHGKLQSSYSDLRCCADSSFLCNIPVLRTWQFDMDRTHGPLNWSKTPQNFLLVANSNTVTRINRALVPDSDNTGPFQGGWCQNQAGFSFCQKSE